MRTITGKEIQTTNTTVTCYINTGPHIPIIELLYTLQKVKSRL